MPRLRNWMPKYEGVQDRALKLYPAGPMMRVQSTDYSVYIYHHFTWKICFPSVFFVFHSLQSLPTPQPLVPNWAS